MYLYVKELPDAPVLTTACRPGDMGMQCHLQYPSPMIPEKKVDQYLIVVIPISIISHSQMFTKNATVTNITLNLNYSSMYMISVMASNCAGNAAGVTVLQTEGSQ